MTDSATPLDHARELTILAWRRTALRWVLIAVVAARIFSDRLGIGVVVVAFVTIVAAAIFNLAASREFSQIRTRSGLPAPALPRVLRRRRERLAMAAAGTLILGLVSLWWVLTG